MNATLAALTLAVFLATGHGHVVEHDTHPTPTTTVVVVTTTATH